MAAAAALAALFVAAVALGDGGGATIASAPELPIGSPVVAGSTGSQFGEFWRITLAAGDLLTIDYGTTNGCTVYLYLYAPTVTDYTYNDARVVEGDRTGSNGKHEFTWIATGTGRWILNVQGCSTLGYQMTAFVQHFTHVTLSAPRAVAARHALQVRGTVSGVQSGKIALRLTARGQTPISALVPLTATGTFAWAPRPAKTGSYRLQAIYYGDSSHRSSRASVTVNVV